MSDTQTINVILPNVSISMDDATFDVLSGASLNVTGSSDTVILEQGAQGITVSGNGNRVLGSGINGLNVSVAGSGNTLSVGNNVNINDVGNGDTFTIGTGVTYTGWGAANASNTTIYATQGGDDIYLGEGGTVYGNNDAIYLATSDLVTVSGSGNQIAGNQYSWSPKTLNLDGSNNAITVTNGAEMTINMSSGSLIEGSNRIVMTGNVVQNGASLTAGVLTMQLGNGNVTTMSGVASGTQIEYIDASGNASWSTVTDTGINSSQANLLVSSMATYSTGSTGISSAFSAVSQEPALATPVLH
jgi:trimeric autotransporter adhesin